MYITSKLIYLEMQKTGCTHISNLLAKYIGGTKVGKHNWLEDYDTNKFIAGSIRNPWDWYVSLWAYGSSERGGLFNRLTTRSSWKELGKKAARLKFKEGLNEFRKPLNRWREVYEDNENPKLFQTWLKLLLDPKHAIDLGENYHASSLRKFAGFMTYRYCKLHMKDFFKKKNFTGIENLQQLQLFDETHNLLNGIIRNESLEEDFINIVQRAGHLLDQTMIDSIRNDANRRTNISEHRDSIYYYDEASLELVSQKDAFIIEKYDYKPPK